MKKSESKYFNTSVKMDKAFISLLKRKSYEYITVSEICKEAGVNRSTFYLHYENISDLLEETARFLLDDFVKHFTDSPVAEIVNLKDAESDTIIYINDKYFLPYLSYIKENKSIFGTVLNNISVFGFEETYRKMFEGIFNPIMDKFRYKSDHRDYVIKYYLNGITAIVREWLRDGCEKSAEEVSEIIHICIYGMNNVE